MTEVITMDKVYRELMMLKRELDAMKQRMVEVEVFLTPDEEARLEESLEEYRQGKSVSLKNFKREK